MSIEISKKEKVTIINNVWESLQAPRWTKDDLIEFGKAIFSRQSLKEMDKKAFSKVFPFVDQITDALIAKMRETPAPARSGEEKAGEGSGG